MNYISIKEASETTGKSEKTIRRLINKSESRAFIDKNDNKIIIDVNYLFSIYPPIKRVKKESRQKLDMDKNEPGQVLDIDKSESSHLELINLKNKIAIYEQELKHKESLLNEKDNRISDLQKAMLLLEAHKEKEPTVRKRWWQF